MAAINYTLTNYGSVSATINAIEFDPKNGINHTANLSNFGGYLAGETAYTGNNTYPSETATVVDFDIIREPTYVAHFTTATVNYLVVSTTVGIKAGYNISLNGYNGSQQVVSVTSATWISVSATPSFPPTVGQAVRFTPDDIYLYLDDITGIRIGDQATGNGYDGSQIVLARNIGLDRLTMSDYPSSIPSIGGQVSFTDITPITVLAPGASIPFTVDYVNVTTTLGEYPRDIRIYAEQGGAITKTINNFITLSTAPVVAPPDTVYAIFYDGGGGGDSGTAPCSDTSSVSCAAPGGGCFSPDTMVTMANGTKKRIADVQAGDLVQGQHGPNRVLKLLTFVLDTNKLHGFNGLEPFVTSCHPIKTKLGWAAFDPEYLEKHWPEDWDTLCKENQGPVVKIDDATEIAFYKNNQVVFEQIKDHNSVELPDTYVVYNLSLDNDHTFITNDIVVHNKGGCFTEDTMINLAGGTTRAISKIEPGDFVVDALTGKLNKVIGVKVTENPAGRKIFATRKGDIPFITEEHPFYNEQLELCAISSLCEELAPWLGPVKIVEVPEITVPDEPITVYNLILENGNTHYANNVPVNNIIGHGGAFILFDKGYLSFEDYRGYINHLEDTVGLNSFTSEQKVKVYKIVNSCTKYIMHNNNLRSKLLANVMSWAIRNRTTLFPYVDKWFKSRIRNWIFVTKK
jgi:hypothetical protein